MASEPNKIQAILYTRGGEHLMCFCRGPKKNCTRDLQAQSFAGPCPDCYIPREDQTIGEVHTIIERGN